MLHGVPLAHFHKFTPTDRPCVAFQMRYYFLLLPITKERKNSPQLYTELVLDVIVVPVILPKLVPTRIGSPGRGTVQMCQVRLRIIPV